MKDFPKHIKDILAHTKRFWKRETFKPMFQKYGFAFVAIVITWEIVEDGLVPTTFGYLGHTVHPFFYSLVLLPWLFSLGPLVVPAVWNLYCRLLKKPIQNIDDIRNILR